jgi:C-terminal processing protease CtpA/Prc
MFVRTSFALLLLAGVATSQSSTAQTSPAPAVATAPHSRAETIEDLATKLIDRFVDPEVGKRYAAMLRTNAAAGKYDAIADDAAFAKQVTADLQAVAFDGHLKLTPAKEHAPGGPATAGKKPDIPEAIEAAARLNKDVAYIRLGRFFGEPENVAAIKKFLLENQDAKTIIFDVRTHIGGGLDEMDAMFPLLFDKETTLVDMDTRVGVESPIDEGPTLRRIAAPESVVRREHFVIPADGPRPLAKAKVFVLASGRTGSAGEHFVLAMKRTHRATVIGETTYGAGNYGNFQKIAGGFSAFIPVGRTFDPDTGKGWDYVGVAPNIAVPAAQALTEALVRSGISKTEAEALSAKYGPSAEDVSSQRKAPASVAGI